MGGIFGKKRPRDENKSSTTPATSLRVNNSQQNPKSEDKGKEKTYTFKVLTIGDCGVGKSSLNLRFAKGSFSEQPDPSSNSNDVLAKTMTVDNCSCFLKIWDTAGQERFNTITASFYRGANIIIIAFDLTNKQTFDNLQQWLQEADRFASEDAQKLIVGTKYDLESEKMVTTDDAQQFCAQKGITYIETSAKTGHNIDYVYTTACHEMLEAIKNGTVVWDDEM